MIVADDPLARAGIGSLLGDQPLATVTGAAASDDDLAAASLAFAPDVAIWDLGWNAGARIDALSRFCDEQEAPVVALLAHAGTASEVLAAGAAGILPRSAAGAQVAAAALAAASGLHVTDPALSPPAPPLPPSEGIAPIEPLSNREREVLAGLAEGMSNKQLARSLGISEHTVKFHINAILGKLGAQSRTEAVVRATRAGLILL